MIRILLAGVAVTGLMVAIRAAPAQACSDAEQRLRFLLGQSQSDLVVLALDLRRADIQDAGDFSVRWSGQARVELLKPTGATRVYEELGQVDVPARSAAYSTELAPIFARAEKVAAGLPRFARTHRTSYRRCHQRRACGGVSVSVKDGRLVIRDGTRRVTREVPREILARLLDHGPGLTLDEASPKEIDDALADLRIVHLLRYRIGGREVLVANLGYGGERHAWPDLAAWPPRGCASLARCPPATTTLHHGVHVDLVVDSR